MKSAAGPFWLIFFVVLCGTLFTSAAFSAFHLFAGSTMMDSGSAVDDHLQQPGWEFCCTPAWKLFSRRTPLLRQPGPLSTPPLCTQLAMLVKAGGNSIFMDADATSDLHRKAVAVTDDSFKFIWIQELKTVIKAIYTGAEFLETVTSRVDVGVVLESTSFYVEQGYQIYDTGSLEGSFGSFEVSNVQVFGGFVVHIGSIIEGSKTMSIGDNVTCKVDYNRHTLIAPNHTCTHMLNFALREVLGNHVDQKGSIVIPEKLRYDFSHGKPIQPEALRKIEQIVNKQIEDELDVYASEASLSVAKQITELRAVFGEVNSES